MMQRAKLLEALRNNPRGVRFSELRLALVHVGFVFKRQSGSHLVYYHPIWREHMIVQEQRGMAKRYQVEQFLDIVAARERLQ